MSARTITGLNLFDGDRLIPESWVVIDGVIRDFGQGEGWKKYTDSPEDGTGKFLTPKMIDTHAHGAAGYSNDNGLEDMLKVIEFYKSLEGKNVYVKNVGFKSYAPLFYTKKPNRLKKENRSYKWLTEGKIDREVYFITKINNDGGLRNFDDIKEIRKKNGFVFFKRSP